MSHSDPTGDRIRAELKHLDDRGAGEPPGDDLTRQRILVELDRLANEEAALRQQRAEATNRLEQVVSERARLEAHLRHAEKSNDRGGGGR